MDQPDFTTDASSGSAKLSQAPKQLAWRFDAHSGLDRPFHGLISQFGHDVIMDLDEIVLDPPLKAAVRATRVFQKYSAQIGREGETREVMAHLASAMKPNANVLDDVALVPPEAVFTGFSRPRG